MHLIQKTLLKRLVHNEKLKYSELTEDFDFEDNVVFHLKQLQKNEFITKEKGSYKLTKEGLVESGKFDLETLTEREFKHIYIGFVIKHNDKFALRDYTSINKGFYKLPGHKAYKGESMEDSRLRLLKEEINIPDFSKIQFKYLTTHFKIQKSSEGKVLFDDALTIYEVDLSQLEEKIINLRKQNKWFTVEQIKNLENKWPEVDIIILENDLKIKEYEFVNDYNLEK